MAFLIDTCVLSEPLKRRPNGKVVGWLDSVDEDLLHVSVLTFGELEKGIARLTDQDRVSRLRRWVDLDLARRFEGRTLRITKEVSTLWGRICGEAEKRGDQLPVIDSLIGATALAHGFTVATRNTADMGRTGAQVFNPWT